MPLQPDIEQLLERLREKHHSGQYTMGGGMIGPEGASFWGGEKIMVYRNPDGPEAAGKAAHQAQGSVPAAATNQEDRK